MKSIKKQVAAVGLLGMTAVHSVWAALPTPVAVVATLPIHVSTGSDDGRLRRPRVVMVEPTEDRKPDDVSTDLRDRPRRCKGRYPLKQPLMRTGTIEVGLNVLPQYTMQLPFAEYYHVVQAFPTHSSEEPLTDWIQIRASLAGSSRLRCPSPRPRRLIFFRTCHRCLG